MKSKKTFPILLIIFGLALLGTGFVISTTEKEGEVMLEITKRDKLMPAAHNVYANKKALNGKYYLFKAKITNNTKNILNNVTIKYQIPGYIEWTELEVVGKMLKGQSTVILCYPKFDPEITNKTTESIEKVQILVEWEGTQQNNSLKEEFDFKLANRNEFIYTDLSKENITGWADIFDNTVLLPCFVTPNDPVVQYYTQNIQEKILKGEKASITKTPTEVIRFLTGIYEATLKSGMVYSGVKGIPSNLKDNSQFSQHNRLPREVITGNTGLCLELSLLYASVLSNAGLEPVIFMIPGHAFPGVVLNGSYYAIEATGIGGEGIGGRMTTEKAFAYGMNELRDFFKHAMLGNPKYSIVDVVRLNQKGVTPMYLGDDSFLKSKVDEITARWNKPTLNLASLLLQQTYNAPSANLSFAVPSIWEVYRNPDRDFPYLTAQAVSPNGLVIANIFDFPGTGNRKESLKIIQKELAKSGETLVYTEEEDKLSGYVESSEGKYQWVGRSVLTMNGLRFIMIGSIAEEYDTYNDLIEELYDSIEL